MTIYYKRVLKGWPLFIIFLTMLGLGCSAGGIKTTSLFKGESLYLFAEKQFEKGNFDEAQRLYKEYLKFEPNSSLSDNSLFRLGEIALARMDYDTSTEFFQRIINNHPESELISRARFNLARSLFLNASWNKALYELKKFQKDFPASQFGPEIILMLSEIYLKTKEYKKVKEEIGMFLKLYPGSVLKYEALYQLGLSEMYLNEIDLAVYHLEEALLGKLDEGKKLNIFYALGTIHLIKGDVYSALNSFSTLFKYSDTEERKKRIVQKIRLLLKNQFSEDLLVRIIEEYPNEFPSDLAMLEIAGRKLERDEIGDAIFYWELFIANFPHHGQVLNVKEKLSLFNKKETPETYSAKFGCIAPLTGPLSEYGEKMVRGIKMAIEEYNQKYNTTVKLVLFDSQAKPDKVHKGIELLANQEKVAAVIGPLLTSTAMAAADIAEQIGIPLFTPTATGDGLPEVGRYIFRNCLTNRHQAEALANFSVKEMGLTSFGILFPFNPYGQEMMALFADQIDKLGANLEIIEFYDPRDTDFKEQLIRIHKINPEALFLPDSYEKILLIAPQIFFYEPEEIDPNDPNQIAFLKQINPNTLNGNLLDINEISSSEKYELYDPEEIIESFVDKIKGEEKRPIQLLGTDGWYDKRTIKEADPYVNGAIISVGFFPESNDNKIVEFLLNFRTRYGESPDLISAQSYDAANMLLVASDGGRHNWDTIRENLSQIKDFYGVSGRTTILPSGDSHKEVTLLKVNSKGFQPIEETIMSR